MLTKNKLDKVQLADTGIALQFKSGEQENIPFSELHKIYLDVERGPGRLDLLMILVLFAGFLVITMILQIEIEILLLILLLVSFMTLKTLLNYKRYLLKITLCNGEVYSKRIPKSLKYETLEIINAVHKKLFQYKIRN